MRRRHPDRGCPVGYRLAHDRAGADHGIGADLDAVEDFRAGAQPRTVTDRDAGRDPRLLNDRPRGIAEIVIAADEIAVRRKQRVSADAHAARRKDLAVEADVRAVAKLDVAVLARQDGVASDERAASDPDARIRRSLRIDQAVVVDHDVVADADLVGMAKHHVLPKDDVPSAGAEQQRIKALAKREPERTGNAL